MVWALYRALCARGDDPDLPDRAMGREITNVSCVHIEKAKVPFAVSDDNGGGAPEVACRRLAREEEGNTRRYFCFACRNP